jgi:putative tryptophan/tyrosine transport system substrate-binding protein
MFGRIIPVEILRSAQSYSQIEWLIGLMIIIVELSLMNKFVKNAIVVFCLALMALSLLLSEQATAKEFTIGVMSDISIFLEGLDGFKRGMKEYGYIEGKNIRYIYDGEFEDNDKVFDVEIKKLLNDRVDMLLTFGNHSSLRARKVAEGSGIPVVMCLVNEPVQEGIVKDLKHPGGNVTGVRVSNVIGKAIEWFLKITPSVKKIYVPYNPEDKISIQTMAGIEEIATGMGIQLVLAKTHSLEDAVQAINSLPRDIGGILLVPSPTLNSKSRELNEAAIKRKIPLISSLIADEAIPITFANELDASGKQAARIAHQIILGSKPADLPVETSDISLIINLRTAEKIGLNISDDILAQAKKIIR